MTATARFTVSAAFFRRFSRGGINLPRIGTFPFFAAYGAIRRFVEPFYEFFELPLALGANILQKRHLTPPSAASACSGGAF